MNFVPGQRYNITIVGRMRGVDSIAVSATHQHGKTMNCCAFRFRVFLYFSRIGPPDLLSRIVHDYSQ